MVANKYLATADLDTALLLKNEVGLLTLFKKSKIDFEADKLAKLALYELCEELIRIFKLNAQPNAYIQFFLDEVLNYSIKKNNNLADFIEHWEEKRTKASLIVPLGLNAVSIMTIHRSKGLEFPVVILPFSDSKVEAGKKNLWIDIQNPKIPELVAAIVPTNVALEKTAYAHLYEEEKNKSLLDNLNVMYVALTRAEERIYVFTGKPTKTPSALSNATDMFAHYFQSSGLWNDAQAVYSFGTATNHKPTTKHEPMLTYALQTFNSNQWRGQIKMRAAAPGIWNTQMAEVKKDYGVIVHTALSKIKTKADVNSALNAMLQEGLITNDEQERLQHSIATIIALPQLKPYFELGVVVKNESEIITEEGLFFRPDRVVIQNSIATVIDYKTGGEKSSHKKQVIEYADLLTKMGYTVKEKLLVYIEEQRVVLV